MDEITVQINELKKGKIKSLSIKYTQKKFLKIEIEPAVSNAHISQNRNIGTVATVIPLVTTSQSNKQTCHASE